MRRSHALAGIALLAVCIAACKSKEKSESGDSQKKPTEAEVKPKLTRGGVVRMLSNEPKHLNPIIEPRFVVANNLIFEGLVGVNAKLEPVERLAKSWEFSADNKTVTFKLRDNVKWHDGLPFTSADVAFTYEAIKSTTAATPWKAYMAPIAKLETPDDRTVVVTYTEPYALALVTWTVGIVPKHKFPAGDVIDMTSPEANKEAIGTGPFKFSALTPGKRMYLEANKDWWHKRPHLDGIEFVFGIGEAEALQALKDGQLDWTSVKDVNTWMSVATTAEFLERFKATSETESRIRLIAWNTQRAPFDDKRVRRGLTHALDRSRIVTDVMFHQARALATPMFPNMYTYDETIGILPFDLDAAKKQLDEVVPEKDGKRMAVEVIALSTLKGPTSEGMAAIFERDLAKVGVEFKLVFLDTKEYYDRIGRRDYDGVYFGWLPDIPDPDPAALLHSSQAQSGANFASYSNPEVDKLVYEGRTTLDRDARRKVYQKLQALLLEEMPYTPLYAPMGHFAWSNKLHGVTPHDVQPQAPLPGITAWWIEK
jgi:peptide/nickel transport system substrate-binding protein